MFIFSWNNTKNLRTDESISLYQKNKKTKPDTSPIHNHTLFCETVFKYNNLDIISIKLGLQGNMLIKRHHLIKMFTVSFAYLLILLFCFAYLLCHFAFLLISYFTDFILIESVVDLVFASLVVVLLVILFHYYLFIIHLLFDLLFEYSILILCR